MQVQMRMNQMQMQVQMHPPQGNQMQVQVQMPHLHLQMQMHLSTSLHPTCPLPAAAVMLFHHILSIYGTSFVMYRGMNGAEMMLTICGSELTNPFLQLRWFLRETNHHKTWYSELNIAAFVLLFTVSRVGIGTWFITIYVQHPRPDLTAKLGSVMFYLVSMLFWFHIVRYALKHFNAVYFEWGATQVNMDDDERSPSVPPSSDTLAWSATEPKTDDMILDNGVDTNKIDWGETEGTTDDKLILSVQQSSDTMLANGIATDAEHSAALQWEKMAASAHLDGVVCIMQLFNCWCIVTVIITRPT